MKKEDCFNLGKITRIFGTKGELTLVLDVDDPNDYLDLESNQKNDGIQRSGL